MRPVALLAVLALAAHAAGVTALDKDDPPAVPAPSAAPVPTGAYQMDKAHTSLVFRVNHLGFSTFTGRFTGVDAKLQFNARNPAASQVSVDIDPRTIEADNAPSGFLQALAGKNWLDAERFPAMTFRSRSIERAGKGAFRVQGDLTLHGVTRPIVLDAKYNGGYAGHPYDPQARIGFSAQGSFKRSEFGVSNGIPAAGSSFGVGDEVEVILETEFTGPPLAP
jgi:polyisoprenoid-binding protein YceI